MVPPTPLVHKRPCLVSGGGGAREPSLSIFQSRLSCVFADWTRYCEGQGRHSMPHRLQQILMCHR